MYLTYKYRLYPTRTQEKALDRLMSFGWRIWNDALNQRIVTYQETGKGMTWQEQSKYWGQVKKEHPDTIGLLPFDTVTELVKRLDKAYKAFFRRRKAGQAGGFPKPKKRRDFRSLEYGWGKSHPTGRGCNFFTARPGVAYLRLMNVGDIKIDYHRPFPCGSSIARLTVRQDPDKKWYVTFQLDIPFIDLPVHPGGMVGIDLGLVYLLALSDGTEELPDGTSLKHPKWHEQAQRKRRVLQRKIDRQRRAANPGNFNEDGTVKTGVFIWRKSNRQRDTEAQLPRLDSHITQQRWYYWHRVTDWLTRTYSVIALEALTLEFMQQNKNLALSVYDAAFGMFWFMLQYKAEKTGTRLLFVPPAYTSQTCSVCGHVAADNRKTQARFRCVACGHEENADFNAAKVILEVALKTSVQDVQGEMQTVGSYMPCDARNSEAVAMHESEQRVM